MSSEVPSPERPAGARPPLSDAHNHLQDEWLTPHRAAIWRDLAKAGVAGGVVNGTHENDWAAVLDVCQEGRDASGLQLRPSFGVHPWHVGNRSPEWKAHLLTQLDRAGDAAIGEIGLDRWMLDRARPDDPRLAGLRRAPLDEQIEVFREQLAIAAERNLPATIHCLSAFGALDEVLRASPRPARGFLLHAYSGPVEMVPTFAKLGAYFSFNGSFLDPRHGRMRAVYVAVPADRLLVETDAPAMPVPDALAQFPLPRSDTGARVGNPADVLTAYEGLARWREMSVEELAAQLPVNFVRLFGP